MIIRVLFLFCEGHDTDSIENVCFIIARSLFAGETCEQSCSLATAFVLSDYTAVT
jgi:hypothetical protein